MTLNNIVITMRGYGIKYYGHTHAQLMIMPSLIMLLIMLSLKFNLGFIL